MKTCYKEALYRSIDEIKELEEELVRVEEHADREMQQMAIALEKKDRLIKDLTELMMTYTN